MIRDSIHILRARWANLHPSIRLVGALGLLTLVAWTAVGPVYRAFKDWRMDQNLVAAQVAVDEARMQEARDLSLTVLRSGDLGIQAFRILEKSAAALGDPRHSEIARALILHPDASEEDQLTGFLAVSETMPLGVVGRAWTELTEVSRAQSRFATIFSKRLLTEKRLSESAQVLLAVPEKDRNSDVIQGLVRILIASGNNEGFEEAQRMIAQGLPSSEKGDVSGWLGLLETLPISSLREDLLSSMRSLPENVREAEPARLALVLARLDYAAALSDPSSVLEQTIVAWKAKSPEWLAQFLIDLKLHQLLLKTYPVNGIEAYPTLLPSLLTAAEVTEAWDLAEYLLDISDGRMPKYLALAHRAMLVSKSSEAKSSGEIWRAAISEAKTDPTNLALLKLHQIAVEAGLNDLATSIMLDAIRQGRGPLPLYNDQKALFQTLTELGKDTTLMEVCAIYLNFEPSNPVLLTQYAYLACLNDVVEPDRLLPPLKLLSQAYPKEMPIYTTLATVHLCAGQPGLASEVLAPYESQSQEMAPSYRIVFLAAKVLMGKIPANDPQIESFPWTRLLASERRKFSFLIRNME